MLAQRLPGQAQVPVLEQLPEPQQVLPQGWLRVLPLEQELALLGRGQPQHRWRVGWNSCIRQRKEPLKVQA